MTFVNGFVLKLDVNYENRTPIIFGSLCWCEKSRADFNHVHLCQRATLHFFALIYQKALHLTRSVLNCKSQEKNCFLTKKCHVSFLKRRKVFLVRK